MTIEELRQLKAEVTRIYDTLSWTIKFANIEIISEQINKHALSSSWVFT